jgi:hypothetical protein
MYPYEGWRLILKIQRELLAVTILGINLFKFRNHDTSDRNRIFG